jgi:hypothetical protein
MEMIDQIEASGEPLALIEKVFHGDRRWAMATIERYLQQSVIMLALSGDDSATPLSNRECYEALWTDESWSSDPNHRRVFVHLTDEGCDRWQRGDWVDPWEKIH